MTAATLTHALADFRRLAATLRAAEIARRAVLIREAEKIADEVALECQLTRDMIAAFQQAHAAELEAVLAETAELSGQKDEKPQPQPADIGIPTSEPSGEKNGKAAGRVNQLRPAAHQPVLAVPCTPDETTSVRPDDDSPASEETRQIDHILAEAARMRGETRTTSEETAAWRTGEFDAPATDEADEVFIREPTADQEDAALASLLGVPAANAPAVEAPTNGKATTPRRRKRGV